MQRTRQTSRQATERDTELRARVRRPGISVPSSSLGLHFDTGRGDYPGDGFLPAETTARPLGHQAKKPGHGHLQERGRVLE